MTVISNILWTDNSDGTAIVTFETDVPTYGGVNYGSTSQCYSASAFDYSGTTSSIAFATSHSVPVPDAFAGGTEADGTWYFHAWTQTASGFNVYSDENTGTLLADGIFIEGTTDKLLMETGDILLTEAGTASEISDFTAASALTGTEKWAFVQGGVTVYVTTDQLKTYVNG